MSNVKLELKDVYINFDGDVPTLVVIPVIPVEHIQIQAVIGTPMTKNNSKLTSEATLRWSLDIECPHCGEDIDLADTHYDMDYVVANHIFHNKWGELKGYGVFCKSCEKEFEIGEVVY